MRNRGYKELMRIALVAVLVAGAWADALQRDPLIQAPSDPDELDAWRAELHGWREKARNELDYDGSAYGRPEFAWVPSCYAVCFLMVYDQRFFDVSKGQYLIDEFLQGAMDEFGGFDGVVLWHAYPRLGFDERNQFDFYRDLPGGLEGLRRAVGRFHEKAVKVFINYNPWDTGTRREPQSDMDTLVAIIRDIEGDGIFLDTMASANTELREMLDAVRPGVALESEGQLPFQRIHDHQMSWAQWFSVHDGDAPGVLRNKWFERRHMLHQIHRWEDDHSGESHLAWMNGSGMLIWENVFGSWKGWTARDKSIVRMMLPIQRRFVDVFTSEDWTPLIPTLQPGVYASRWEHEGLRLWTLVNRTEQTISGALLRVSRTPGAAYYDLMAGETACMEVSGNESILSGTLRPRGIGALAAGDAHAMGGGLDAFLASQAALNAQYDDDPTIASRTAKLTDVIRTTLYSADRLPAGMVAIPAQAFEMKVTFRIRECGFYDSQPDMLFTHSSLFGEGRLHEMRTFDLGDPLLTPYAMDETLVTNQQYYEFLADSGYTPQNARSFLKHWVDGKPPAGKEDHPVVYVSLEDARAYANWASKRLPTEAEWQYAAGGTRGLTYPWGDAWRDGVCNGDEEETSPVKAFPEGRSPFGCYDMCGNVWEWTESERSDGRTRFCMLRGGSYYKAEGSEWYAEGGPHPCNYAAKFLLLWPGLDRCSTIGFRCVVDLAQNR